MRLDFTGAWPLGGVMLEADDTIHHEIVRRLFCLITVTAEDAAALAVEGQTKELVPDSARAAANSLRVLGARIESLSAAITELIQSVGKDDATT